MREYLYVDDARLQGYVDQISSPVVYDKVPELNVELSLLGPKAGASQKRPARSRTTHESLQLLESHLKREGLVEHGRLGMMQKPRRHFYQESLEAFSGILTSKDSNLKLWLSRDAAGKDRWAQRALILIEDFRGDDSRHPTVSSYSGLTLLAYELEWLTDKSFPGLHQDLMKHDFFEDALAEKPFSVLEKLGFRFGPSRPIMALYRFRSSCAARMPDDRGFISTIIGYPIAIWQ